MLGLYVHVPFCSAICNYCNFNRGLFDAALKARYVDAVVAEIRNRGALAARGESSAAFERRCIPSACVAPPSNIPDILGRRALPGGRLAALGATPDFHHGLPATREATREQADTIFFGGGTPSLLEPADIQRIVGACRDSFDLADDREVTLEANPETVTEDRLAAYRAAGVNRLSFGVQSFRDDELKRLSRLHGVARARASYREARRAGFDNVSLDLMMWLPAQRLDDWLESIDAAIALGPEHLSLYLLEVYPNAPLKDEMARSAWSQAPDDDAAAMYLTAMDRLDLAGYSQYEISNVARPGRQSRHNLKYWSDGEWLGFGCGAHSTRHGTRWKNLAATGDYVDRIADGRPVATDVRQLSADQRLGDALFTGLRLTAGVNLDAVRRRYGVDVWERHGAELEPFIQDGCLGRDRDRMWLTRRGMLLANEVMTVFV